MSNDYQIIPHDEVYCKVLSENKGKLLELSEAFSFQIPNARFHPKVRAKIWNGKINLYNINTRLIYKGLIPHIVDYAKQRNYTVGLDASFLKDIRFPLTYKETEDYINSLQPAYKGELLTPHLHQVEGVQYILNNSRGLIQSPTGSGKSLIIYSIIRYYLENVEKKVLLIVPNLSLVAQMGTDFVEYSSKNGWNVDNNVHLIYEGQPKNSQKYYEITLQNNKTYKFLGNEYIKIINNLKEEFKKVSELTIKDDVDEIWIQKNYKK